MITLNFLPTALLLSCFILSAAACVALLADEINQSQRNAVRDFDVYTSPYGIQQNAQLGSRNKLKSTVQGLANTGLSDAGSWATVQRVVPPTASTSPQYKLTSLPRAAERSAVAA